MTSRAATEDLGEGPALLRVETDPALRVDPKASDVVHPAGNGRCEVVVYYRPQSRWADRYVWLQIDPEGAASPVRLASRMVRKRGFEPLRSCYRQPLKLVRLMLATSAFRGLNEICRPDQLVRLYILSTN